MFQCGCGLRFGDLGRITWDDIYSNRIEITTEKTKQILRIPLNKYRSWVIDRNQGKPELMHPTANQIQNRYLKELGAHKDWGVFGLGFRPGNSCLVSNYRLKGKNRMAKLLCMK